MQQLCESLDALAEGVSLAAPDMVRQLLARRQEIVPVVDERLAKSAQLLQRGLRDEAVRYAAEPPGVVQAATLLDISRQSRWKVWAAKLAELNIPAPTMPRMDLVAALTSAEDELARLQPLLDAWRRMNLANAPLPHRIAMLGKLRKADPENELWFAALQEHQKHRIPGLEREMAAAVSAHDDNRLEALVAEMQQEWIEPVPPRILATAKSALETFRGSRIDRDLDALADSLAAAHDARDIDAARTLRDRWQELVDQKGSFAVDDPRLAAALPAVSWVDAHARMETVSEEIWNSLDARPRGIRARQDWVRGLERLGNEMEDLAEKLAGEADGEAIERAHERIGRQRAQLDSDLRFRRMMMYVGIASAVMVLGLGVWYFDRQSRFDRSVAAALRDLRAAQEQVAAGVLEELPDFAGMWTAGVAANAEVGSLLAIVRGELKQQTDRRTRLAAALENARGNLRTAEAAERADGLKPWPPAFAEASRSLAEIEEAKLAMTDKEQGGAAGVKAQLDRLGRKLVGEADSLCRERIAALDAELDKARNLVDDDGTAAAKILADAKLAIAALYKQAAAVAAAEAAAGHKSIRLASQPIISLLAPDGPLTQKIESIDGMLLRRRKYREALQELDRRLGNWSRYAEQLEAIGSNFAEFSDSRDYARAAESKAQWNAVDAWRGFQPSLQQLHLATPERAGQILARFESLPDEAKNLPIAKRIREDVMSAVEQLAKRDPEKLGVDLETWFSGTWVEELKFVVHTEDETAYYCLEGPQPGAFAFKYVPGRKDAQAGWPTKNENKIVARVEPSPQAKLADVLRAVVRKASPTGGVAVDQLFVDLLEAVVAAKEVDPILRLVTARKILFIASENSRPCREAGRRLTKLLDDGQGGIPGIPVNQIWSYVAPSREQDPTYQDTKKKSETLLKEIQTAITELKDAIDKERAMLTSPPLGSFVLAGRLARNDAGAIVAIWQGSAPSPGRLWWFPAGADAAVAGTVDDKGVFRPEGAASPAGTPLFTITSERKLPTKTGQ